MGKTHKSLSSLKIVFVKLNLYSYLVARGHRQAVSPCSKAILCNPFSLLAVTFGYIRNLTWFRLGSTALDNGVVIQLALK